MNLDKCHVFKSRSGRVTRVQCKACGNPDCSNATTDPYWSRCPADWDRQVVAEMIEARDEGAA